jgi:uncharacterized protein (DUF362 family)
MADKARVAALRCDPRSEDHEVARTIDRAADLVGGIEKIFAGKRKVIVKPNIGTDDVRLHLGRQVALTDPSVLRATVALIRRYFDGDLVIGEATTGSSCHDIYRRVGHNLDEFGVRVVDLKDGPFVEFPLPAGLMFNRYFMSHEFVDADLIVSVAKMKSHLSTGATLCLKNLFGMTPVAQYGTPRRYLHAPVRLPRVLVDVAQLFPPSLCVIDGLVGADEREWHGPPMEPGVIVLGNNVVATDATAMRLMGMDPELDYTAFPYYFDRNPIVLAANAGLGSPAPSDIEVLGDVPTKPLLAFTVGREQSAQIQDIRESVAGEVDTFLRERARLLKTDQGRYAAMANGEVVALADSVDGFGSRAALTSKLGSSARGILIKQVLPPEQEDERLDVYQTV